MAEHDIIFTAHSNDRKIDYVLYEGIADKYGYEHIKKQREYVADHIDIVKYGVENQNVVTKDSDHMDRDRIYCKGADATRPDMYIEVIAEFYSTDKCNIITAWQTHDVKGDVITYVKAKR